MWILTGDYAVIGALNSGNPAEGYIFNWDGANWTEDASMSDFEVLTDMDGQVFAGGLSVSIDGHQVAIGADGAGSAGAAYLFTRAMGGWSETATIRASDGVAGDGFGHCVSLSGNDVVCGAPFVDGAVTDGGAVYVIEDVGVISAMHGIETATAFTLAQNFPNPCSSTTEIRMSADHSGQGRLSVYNQAGQEVCRLVDGRVNEGVHNFVLDSDELPVGVYYYTMQIGRQVQSRKMIVQR